jgi:hypothetical protein
MDLATVFLSFEIEEAPFNVPNPGRFILTVGFFFVEEAANNPSIAGL